MTDERTTICTNSRIVSIKVSAESRVEIEVEWSTVSLVTKSGRSVHLVGTAGTPDIEIVAIDEDEAEDLLIELSTRHAVGIGGTP